MTDIKPLVQKLAFLAIFIKNVAMSKLGPADSVEKKGRDQTVCSEINIFSQFHHTKHVSISVVGTLPTQVS